MDEFPARARKLSALAEKFPAPPSLEISAFTRTALRLQHKSAPAIVALTGN
jgi:hypothetical protein